MVLRPCILLSLLLSVHEAATADEAMAVIDTTTMHHKVMCGYQGWFRCAGDASNEGWRHWSRDSRHLDSKSVTVEMWPDMTEYDEDEKYPAPGFSGANGEPVHLFSSAHPKTVDRHFQWMQQYGIDGIFLQRFLVQLNSPSLDQVLTNVRRSANKTGRTFGICYDLSGMPKEKIFGTIVADWKRLVDEQQVTRDPRYLHHNNKPVLFIWGFYSDRFEPEFAEQMITFFKNDPTYGVTLIGGCEWWWRTEKNPAWSKVFRKFDIISPWNPGNSAMINGERHAATASWKDDLAETKRVGIQYLPVIYPGFGWTNLVGEKGVKDDLPRLNGEFFWRQFSTAADLGVEMAYVAMFDEVDEATAIFKVTNTPPKPGRFVTYEGLPSDWYLRLTGEGTKLIRGKRQNQTTVPIKP